MRRWFRRTNKAPEPGEGRGTEGYLDTCEAGLLTGWAFRPATPERRIRVHVLVDGRIVAGDIADRYRVDLETSGRGDGRHSFAITLPPALLDGREHNIEVIDAETGTRLHALARRQYLDRRDDAVHACLYQLCDARFYQGQAGPVDFPLDHYRQSGWLRGFDPHPLFSTRHYLAQNGAFSGDPLTHFAEIGQWANAWTHPLLDPRAEDLPLVQSPDRIDRDNGESNRRARRLHPLMAYLNRQSAPDRPLSQHFSDADYLARYPGVGTSGILPLPHYIAFGWREGLRPHPDFDPRLFARLANLDNTHEPYGHFITWLGNKHRRTGPSKSTAPDVSVILLNHNKSLLTLQCLYYLDAYTEPGAFEVVVIDNGSRATEFEMLARCAQGITLVRLDTNHSFGEANNIGAEHARGRLLMFLNNDAFARPGWLKPLQDAIDADASIGAAGAKLLYPDGRLQEAGAMISACGTALQRGKHLDSTLPAYNRQDIVDYCSAAALMVRADAFRAVLGFDLAWDPAYYEDADLCLKLRTIGLSTQYVPRSEVVHIEHATSADTTLDLRLHDIVAVNRLKFVGRWGDWLAALPGALPPAPARKPKNVSARAADQSKPLLALYSPYPLVPGGGERYLLTIAEMMRTSHRCLLLTPDRYSRLRLLTIAADLGLDLDHIEVGLASEAGEESPIDLFVCMANELLPPLRGIGRFNLYHCQFPFPMRSEQYSRGWRNLATYHGVVVNTAFTARHFAAASEAIGLVLPSLRIVSPPVPQIEATKRHAADGVRRILNVGRFAPGGHCKRQDLMIAEFARLREQTEEPLELNLAGSLGADSAARKYLQDLVIAARDLPVRFHLNASAEQIAVLYAQADLYWHMTGAGEDIIRSPERFEHFGIALVEAMSAGAVPVALGMGGPAEIITDGHDGVLITEPRDLSPVSARLLADPSRYAKISAAARRRAADFTPSIFIKNLHAVLEELQQGPRSAESLPPAALTYQVAEPPHDERKTLPTKSSVAAGPIPGVARA